MEATTIYPGSIGEIVQGRYNGIDVLCSCPINLFTEVKVWESESPHVKNRYSKSSKFLNNILVEWGEEQYIHTVDILIKSSITRGKGFASSTADLCALYHSLIKLFKKPFNQEELVRNCIAIEPTDSIIFKELCIFDYKNGMYTEELGRYLEFDILVFEGNKTINTIEFNNKKLPPLSNIDDLIPVLKDGIKSHDIKKIAHCSTQSIIRNEKRLSYEILPTILNICDELNGYGIIGAHSGDALGIIYEKDVNLSILSKYKDKLKNYKTYSLKTIKL